MKIAILGTRGIPNQYGGFEQFAQYLSLGLVKLHHQVTVYSPHYHTYKKDNYQGVNIIFKYCPEKQLGPFAHFIYDFLCLQDALKKDFDIIYEAGYTSSAVFYYLLPIKKSILISNMDGLEWKRSKWNALIKLQIKLFERFAIHKSAYLIADNKGIQRYLYNKYKKSSEFISYGANLINTKDLDEKVLEYYQLDKFNYYLIIARIEPENNIDMVLEGYIKSNMKKITFLVIGNCGTKYGKYLTQKYKKHSTIKFLTAIYNMQHLDTLRYFSKLYFHGHSVGGTNPSLLEAMASQALIAAHDNCFNKSILHKNAFFFKNQEQVMKILENTQHEDFQHFIQENANNITEKYSWQHIVQQYSIFFKAITNEHKK